MSTPTDHARPLPDGVLARCSASDPAYYQAHGATTTGLRLPRYADLGAEQLEQSLAALSEDMHLAYHLWLAQQGREETR